MHCTSGTVTFTSRLRRTHPTLQRYGYPNLCGSLELSKFSRACVCVFATSQYTVITHICKESVEPERLNIQVVSTRKILDSIPRHRLHSSTTGAANDLKPRKWRKGYGGQTSDRKSISQLVSVLLSTQSAYSGVKKAREMVCSVYTQTV